MQLHGHNFSRREAIKRIDFLGILLLTAGLTLFLLGVSWGGTTPVLTWNSAHILGLLIPGIVCCVSFVIYECLVPASPIIPMRFFKDVRGFACINVMSAVFGCINIAFFILWPSQVIHIFGSTGSWEQTAWMSCTVNFGIWTGIIIVGPLYHIIKRIRWQLVVATAWMCVFLGVITTSNSGQRSAAIAVSFLSCLPIGWGEVVTMLLVQYLVDDQDLGAAFGTLDFFSRFIYTSNQRLHITSSGDLGQPYHSRLYLYLHLLCHTHQQASARTIHTPCPTCHRRGAGPIFCPKCPRRCRSRKRHRPFSYPWHE